VFNYFSYKELLILEHLDPRWLALMEPIEAALTEGDDPVALLMRALALPAAVAGEHPAFVRILARELVHPSALRSERAERSLAYVPLVTKLLEAGQAAGRVRDDLSALDLGPFLVESALATIARHADAGEGAALAVCREVTLHGVAAREECSALSALDEAHGVIMR
jgi:TetR/AcrR family transcriptional repressors, C-terminal domain